MYIKRYDFYKFYLQDSFIDICFVDDKYIPHSITAFLKAMYPLGTALLYQKDFDRLDTSFPINALYEVDIILDKDSNMVYIVEGYDYDYRYRIPNITKQIIVDMCKKKELYFDIITKINLGYLFKKWIILLQDKPSFALLYQDENDWYDVIPFDSKEVMEEFVQEHTESFYRSY